MTEPDAPIDVIAAAFAESRRLKLWTEALLCTQRKLPLPSDARLSRLLHSATVAQLDQTFNELKAGGHLRWRAGAAGFRAVSVLDRGAWSVWTPGVGAAAKIAAE